MRRMFFGVVTILVLVLVASQSAALAENNGGFCRDVNPNASVCHPN